MVTFGRCLSCEALRSEALHLRTLLSDEIEARMKDQTAFAEERKELVDRILALTSPGAHRLLHPVPSTAISTTQQPRFNWPGVPTHPPTEKEA